MFHAHGPASGDSWTNWLENQRQPLVLVFAASWGATDAGTLEQIRAELRGLGAALVVVTEALSFCFRPDDAHDTLVPAALAESKAIEELYRRYSVQAAEVRSGTLHLTLLDDEGEVRMQSSRPAAGAHERTVLDTLRWASGSLAFGRRVLFSRREAVLLSLIGALALAAVEGCTPKPSPLPKPSAPPAPPRHAVDVTLSVNG